MASQVSRLTWWDTIRLEWILAVHTLLLGPVAPRRWVLRYFVWRNLGQRMHRLLPRFAAKYGARYLWGSFGFKRTLLVVDPAAFDAVLAARENTADARVKTASLGAFAPHALLVSTHPQWQGRRDFNCDVLQLTHAGTLPADPLPHGAAFCAIVATAVREMAPREGILRWGDFEALAAKISQGVLLGGVAAAPQMTEQMAAMVKAANGLRPSKPDFVAFYGELEDRLRSFDAAASPQPECLVNDSARWARAHPEVKEIEVPSQIAFWFFVLKDALELHTARTLALLAAHPRERQRASAEAQSTCAHTVSTFPYLDACLREQLRLWTAVPLLLRRVAEEPWQLAPDLALRRDEQILIDAGGYHRDPKVFGEAADRFRPDLVGAGLPPTYPFSGLLQSCAGQVLIVHLLKATLAALLARFELQGIRPAVAVDAVPHLYDHFRIELQVAERAP